MKTWRSKQFEYGFLRSITHQHRDFLKVTEDALVYTAHLMKLELTPEARERLGQYGRAVALCFGETAKLNEKRFLYYCFYFWINPARSFRSCSLTSEMIQ
jgi:hypothetical protein